MRLRLAPGGRRPVVVLDTNVTVPGLLGAYLIPPRAAVAAECIMAARRGRIQIALSPPLLDEVAEVLQREPLALSPAAARRNIHALARVGRIIAVPRRLSVLARDPDDNMVLETAITARADMLVTWNVDHFEEIGRDSQGRLRYRGVEIVRPPELLRLLRYRG